MIEARNLKKQFIRQVGKGKKEEFNAVDGISLKANEGEILGILGANGAGKTTLLRMLGGMMEPSGGEIVITVNDREIREPIEAKRHIGYLSENTKLYGRLSVREMLKICGEIYGLNKDELNLRIEKISDIIGLSEFIDNRIERLSTGQKQRTSIARCLICDPEIYIFDEPTLGLDVLAAMSIIDFMKSEREGGKCVLYSTHYMEEAQSLCDRVIMVDEGRIIAQGTPDEIMHESNTDNLRDAFTTVWANKGETDEY